MQKDFKTWNIKKEKIHKDESRKLYHTREVWWCSLGINVGFEQDGNGAEYQRPVLILKGLSKDTCLILPLTTSTNKHPMRILAGIVDEKTASVILSQMRVVDTKRFANKIGFLEKEFFENIRKAVKDML